MIKKKLACGKSLIFCGKPLKNYVDNLAVLVENETEYKYFPREEAFIHKFCTGYDRQNEPLAKGVEPFPHFPQPLLLL